MGQWFHKGERLGDTRTAAQTLRARIKQAMPRDLRAPYGQRYWTR